MVANIFAIIQLLLRLIGLWEQFVSWTDAERLKEAEERKQKRDGALDDAAKATTPDEAFKAQEGVVDNEP